MRLIYVITCYIYIHTVYVYTYTYIQLLLYDDSLFKSILTTCSIPHPNARAFLAWWPHWGRDYVTGEMWKSKPPFRCCVFFEGKGVIFCFGWFSWKHFLLIFMYIFIYFYNILWCSMILFWELKEFPMFIQCIHHDFSRVLMVQWNISEALKPCFWGVYVKGGRLKSHETWWHDPISPGSLLSLQVVLEQSCFWRDHLALQAWQPSFFCWEGRWMIQVGELSWLFSGIYIQMWCIFLETWIPTFSKN